jgi:N-acetylneuraminic acid mutarotase
MSGVAVGGLVYAVGGQHGTNEFTGNQDDVDAYDPQTDQWTFVADLPEPLGHITASTFVRNGRIVITAGRGNSGITAKVIEYDPPTDTWVSLPDLPDVRQSVVSGIIGDQIVVTGGTSAMIHTTTWLGVFTDKWESRAALPVALGEVAGGILGDAMHMVGKGSSSTLAYDLATNTWSAPGSLSQRRFVGNHHAAEVFAGELYLLGGLGGAAREERSRFTIREAMRGAWVPRRRLLPVPAPHP